ncbi:hypothetical protein Ccrd_018050 [Cynara cardunculus var. scolymus]|uniref:Uncharacterized protein n=1 Tax=Cynara cardunculus var. scolymus TaxID=59895 RepID=A0A118K212_CYNCS|nr:hypothetical protein Ccrd_018050 [Cynara cardunculus var. scolymus]
MSLGPIITSTRLTKHKVIRPEDLPISSRSKTVHRPWLQIHEHRSWNKPTAASLIVINIDPLELKLRISGILPGDINPMLSTHNLPELSSDLVSALTTLNVEDLSHLVGWGKEETED